MRSDAKKNYEHILSVARSLLTGGGAETSLRDIARKAGVGDGTLHRHFPTRDALLDALLRQTFDALSERAAELEKEEDAAGALLAWVKETVAATRDYSGVIAPMVNAISDENSALHTSCVALRAGGTRLLVHAQSKGMARTDMDGDDLFALISALAWLAEQPPLVPRSGHLFDIIADAILPGRQNG
ncbi:MULTISPECIES: TetR/AcrR family transcriptional regulator [Rhizobium]|uniref:TetR family transcriptional regulator n=1 Tax=Rhizobium wuzhouense TaxID=1986026 RepID=A0ABX5NU72_9HYPH|nr:MULTISPECIES: TetR/AcrR family transcriptional regulator [Rhizobium]PYB75556.1 TetR family transcriptional regulator [Rhizobium wuzhouense]RKE84130.1 TetR family transcriptional regulator [Rhizobium sp. AG855]